MRLILSVAALALGVTSGAVAATQAKRPITRSAIKPKAVSATAPAAPAAPKPVAWQPTPFNEPAGNLTAGYKGENAWEVYQLLNRAAAKTKKDEFETTAQYEARMANPAAIMAPLSVDALYAFQMKR